MKKFAKIQLALLIFILISLTLAFLYSCQNKTHDKGFIVLALENSPANFDPRKGTDIVSARVHEVVFNTLVTPDKNSQLIPELATSWGIIGGKDYIFHLKKGITFHNGKELKAEDVEFTFKSLLDDSFISAKKGSFRVIKDIEVVDDYSIKFILHEPYSSFLINLAAVGILPSGVQIDFNNTPIGTGPFRFINYEEDEELVLEAFKHYFEGKSPIERLIFKIVPDAFTRMLELQKGSIDLAINCIPEDMITTLSQEPNLKIVKKAGSNYSYVGINLQDSILRNRKVRQAIAYAIDREAMIKHLLNNLATPAKGILAKGNWAYEDEVAYYEYNPQRSKELLDQAGFTDPDGEGPEFRFSLTCKISNKKSSRDIAVVMQENLKQVGIGLNIRSIEWQTFYQDIIKGNFQLYCMKWIGAIDPDIYRYVFYSKSIPPEGANRGHYANPELDKLIIKARQTLDTNELKVLYSDIQKKIAIDVPYISLWHSTNIAVMNTKIEGLELFPTASFKALKNLHIAS